MTLLSIALKPFIIGAWMIAYKYTIDAIWKYLPYSISSFLLKKR